ncbi:MAG: vitamin K epoxide reductase family protein [Pyrinomonadaceae bacterium]
MESETASRNLPRWLVIAAILISLVGLIDSSYLTASHYSGIAVPCNLTNGCEMVLNSPWSQIAGIPTALFGAIAYFAVFSTALLVFYGRENLWSLVGAMAATMFAASLFLVYLQAFVIGSFCQFCLLSALSSTLLFVVFAFSKFSGKRQ